MNVGTPLQFLVVNYAQKSEQKGATEGELRIANSAIKSALQVTLTPWNSSHRKRAAQAWASGKISSQRELGSRRKLRDTQDLHRHLTAHPNRLRCQIQP